MIRFTWLQSRSQSVLALGALALVAVVAAITGPHLVHDYHATLDSCTASGTCGNALGNFLRNDSALRTWLGILVIAVPGLLGIFWGAPLVAREYELGTYRLVWTQSVTRGRWLVVKLAVLGLAGMATAGLLSLIVTWWASPLDAAAGNRFNPGVFDGRGIVAVGYAALAVSLGVTAGLLLRRTLPAMTAALVAFVGARLADVYWLRPHLLAAAHATLPLRSATNLGFSGDASAPFTFDNPHISNAWVLSSQLLDRTGHRPTAQVLNRFLQTACPAVMNPSAPPAGVGRAPADQNAFQHCLDQLSANFHVDVAYQQAGRYWTFQWLELSAFLGAAAVLGGFCLWWIRRRRA